MKGIFARIKFNFRIILGIVFLVSTIFCFFFYFSAKASINKQVNYQGKLTNSNNWAVADGNYDMVFKIYDAVSGGSLLWTGTHTAANGNPVTSSAGVFSVLLGSGSGNTLNLDFSNSSNYYLQIEIYNSGTSSWETFSPRRPVASVPQAYNANNVIGDGRIDVTTNSSSNVSLKVTQSGTADVAQFFDGATQVMTVRDGGNVGIGTTAPASKLEVNGVGSFSLGTAALPSHSFTGDLNTGMWSSGADVLNFSTAGSERLRVTSAGKVGIGTTAPSTDLHVTGTSNNTLTLQSNNTAGTSFVITNTSNSANYEFAVTGTGNGYGSGHFLFWDALNSRGPLILNANGNVRVGHDAGYTATAASNLSVYGNLVVGASYVGNAAPSNGMIVQGNTGIGTTNPGSKLEVAGTLTVSGSNLTSLGGNLTVTGTTWTATPTISGLITATSGLTANGALTANNTFTLGDNGDTGSINTSDWDISTTGAMTGIGAITMDGLLTGTAGATISGAAINMNASSNFATNIGTGTSTGAVSIGGGSNTVGINSSAWDISTAGAISGVTTLGMSGVLTSTLATGTAPFSVTSTTLNNNLNADLLDNQHGSYYMTASTDNWVNTTGDTMTGALTVGDSGPTIIQSSRGATNGSQIILANTYAPTIGSIYSGANAFFASNAYQTTNNTDAWAKQSATYSSNMIRLGLSTSSNIAFQLLNSPASTSSGILSSFFTNTLLTVLETGNVGIGTTNPTSQLDVASSASSVIQVRTTDTTGDTPAVRVGQSNNYYGELFYDSTGDYLGLRSVNNGTPNSGIYFPYASGNVGIGTTDPGAYKLNVSGTTYLGGATTVAGNLVPSANDTYDLGSDAARWANIWLGAETLHVGTADADEGEIGYTTSTNVMTVQSNGNLALQASSGNVGIGTTAPAKALNVAGTGEIIRVDGLSGANDQVISIKNNSQTADTSTNIFFADRFGASSYASSYIRGTGSGTSYLSFATGGTNFTNIYDAGAPTEKMRITAGGNIGISTNNPTNKLHVEGTGGGSAGIYLNSAVPSATSNTLYNNGGSLYWNGSAVGGGSSQWTTQGTSIYYNTGNVGIGSTAPNNLFEVGDNALGAQTGKGIFVSNSSGNSHFDLGQGTSNRGRLLWLYNATAASAYLALGVAGGTNNLVLQDAGGNVGIGTTAPGQKVDVSGGSVRTDNQLISTVATGTAPLAVSSTTAVSNLNADMIDGQHASAFATADTVVRLSAIRYYTSGANTWSKPSGLSYVIAEVWGGGGGGVGSDGEYYYSGSTGGTSSFGSFLSATGGGGAVVGGGGGSYGSGSGGNINISGTAGVVPTGGSAPRGGGEGITPGGGGRGFTNMPGGGGGGYAQEMIISSSLSSSHTATVGAGGAGGGYGGAYSGSSGAAGAVVVYEYTTVTSGTDLAENYPVKDPTISAGEIVTFDSADPIGVKRAEQGDKAPMAGIIATKPGLVLSDDQKNATGQRPVALAGRVPTKVNLEGGEIKIGDRIAISSVPGVGRKANSLEPSVGVALEGYTGGDQMITVSIDLNPGIDVNELKNQIFETDMNNADERSKENQQILSYGLNELMLMTPKQYTQISTFLQNGTLVQDRNKTQETFGFIAQELYQLIPQAVKKPKEGSDGLWEIDYSKIVPIVVKSIQEQQAEISKINGQWIMVNGEIEVKALSTEVLSQKLKVESLLTRMENLEATNTANSNTLSQLEQRLAELEQMEEEDNSQFPISNEDSDTSVVADNHLSEGEEVADSVLEQSTALSLSDQLQGEVIANLNISNLTVIENVIVAGDIKVEGHIVVGEDTAGEAVVPTGENKVRIEFKKPYIGQPIVTATLSGGKNLFYSVKNVDTFGFDIIIDGVLRNTETGMKLIEGEEIKTVDFGEAIKFNWQAMEKGSTE